MTNHQNRSKTAAGMRRWTDEKLDKELSFAGPADDGSDECLAWNTALIAEAKRRGRYTPDLRVDYGDFTY